MKKFLISSCIGFCLAGIIATTISAFFAGTTGTILFFGGLMAGICGLSFGALAGHEEKKEIDKTLNKDFDISDYKNTESVFKKDKNFEKHVKQTVNMNASKNSDENQISK